MKTYAKLLFVLLWTCTSAFGSVAMSPPVSGSLDKVSTVLFEVRSDEIDNVSYLFGTHHAFGNTFFDSLQNAHQALLSSQILIKENLDIPGHLAEDIINRRTATTDWTKYLHKRDLPFVDSIFSKSEVDLNKVTPTELHMILSRFYNERICQAKALGDSVLTLDGYIGALGRQQGLQLIGLETIEEQLALIAKDVEGMPRKVHKRRLEGVIERIRQQDRSACSQADWYKDMEFDLQLDQPCQNTLILTERNDKWMLEIDRQLQAGSCFIAVGFSHLMFECGLINQLKQLGYTVQPIPVN
ncbi:TraB/GumN family protein [Catalinimonas sp. 4WD22]|uniref:TraB/GumN family protein n=1 Tax=Catalinimonas locisalis TaxID=3133978 RepID=UPI00310176EC